MASLFRFSEAASLALHAMVFVAARDGEVVKVREMAEVFSASNAHMMKVCQRLTRAGLLEAQRGVGGGFRLGRAAGRVRLLDVYEAIEGRVELNPCLFRGRTCRGPRRHDCIFGKRIMGLEAQFRDYLRTTSVRAVAAVSDLGRA